MLISSLLSLLVLAPAPFDWADEANRLLEQGDISSAIELLEGETENRPEEVLAWRLLGDAYYQLAASYFQADENPTYALSDSKEAYEKALALSPLDRDALRGIYEACYQSSEFEAASAYALTDLAMTRLQDGVQPDWLLERVGRSRVEAFKVNAPSEPFDYAFVLRDILKTLRELQSSATNTATLAGLESDVLQHAQLWGESAAVLEKALPANPSSVDLHQKLVNLSFYQDTVERLPALYRQLAEESPDDATLLWYVGYVHLLAGDSQRKERRFHEALETYATAVENLNRSASLAPGFLESAVRIRVLARGGIAWCHLRLGNVELARETFLDLLRKNPEHRELPDGLQRTVIAGLSSLGGQLEARSSFEVGADVAREVLDYEPESAFWWNNLGFFLREYGSQVETGKVVVYGDRAERAHAIYRESWEAYLKATEFAGDDSRIINDTALIQVYHLRDELDRARDLLQRALEAGQKQLEALEPDADFETRYPIEQAIGDANMNLAYIDYHLEPNWKRARPFFVAAKEIDPYNRSVIDDYVASIDGKRGKVEERPLVMDSPNDGATEIEGQVAWERSFDDARVRAITENRPLLVYVGGGVTPDATTREDQVKTVEFEEASRETVCVVVDKNRYNVKDRRHDGARVPTPSYGVVTSGEHMAAHDQLQAWWASVRGDDQAESLVEGYYWFGPGEGESLVQLKIEFDDDPAVMFGKARAQVGEPRPSEGLSSLGRALKGPRAGDRRLAARRLVERYEASARDYVEGLLLGGELDVPAERELLTALAESDDELHRSLLGALVSQRVNTGISLAALRHWPEGADPQPLRFSIDWSTSSDVRREAGRALARFYGSPDTDRYLAARLVGTSVEDRAQAARALGASGDSTHEFLANMLYMEADATVREAICESLAGASFDSVRAILAQFQESDPESRVRAAASRALNFEG